MVPDTLLETPQVKKVTHTVGDASGNTRRLGKFIAGAGSCAVRRGCERSITIGSAFGECQVELFSSTGILYNHTTYNYISIKALPDLSHPVAVGRSLEFELRPSGAK